jgi:glycosyltransferase involved in cell wall biosynthesis
MTSRETTNVTAQPLTGENESRGLSSKTAGVIVFMVSHSSAGGAQEIWANVAEGFRQRGYDTRLVALYPYRDTVRETSKYLPWSYILPKRPTALGKQLDLFGALVRYFKTEKPSYVFTAMPAANVLAPLAAMVAGGKTKVIISHHSPVNTYNPILNFFDGLAGSLRQTAKIISVSNTVARSLDGKSASYRAKRRTIYNALPPRIEAQLTELAIGKDRSHATSRRVVATGRLATQKNYPALLRAAQHMPDVEVQIVGNGPEEDRLKALAEKLKVGNRVKFMGHRPREEALAILAEASVFTQPSLFEGHSLALVEAAKLGLPLVVSSVPVQVEGITHSDGGLCGITVGAHDDKALAKAILHLLDDADAYKLWVHRAQKLAMEATYDRMMAAYENLVS